jgi:hypothetical protein
MTNIDARVETICSELNHLSHGLMDIYQSYNDAPAYQSTFAPEKFAVNQENLDEFDWSGMQYDFNVDLFETAPKEINWDDVNASIDEAIASGHLIAPAAIDYAPKRSYGHNVLRSAGTYYKGDIRDMDFMLRQLKRLEANPADIFSLDDSAFDRSYNMVSNFEMKVPLEIYGQGEELVIKADIPEILFNSARPKI